MVGSYSGVLHRDILSERIILRSLSFGRKRLVKNDPVWLEWYMKERDGFKSEKYFKLANVNRAINMNSIIRCTTMYGVGVIEDRKP